MYEKLTLFISYTILLNFICFTHHRNAYGLHYFKASDPLKIPSNEFLRRAQQIEKDIPTTERKEKINKIITSLNLYTTHSASIATQKPNIIGKTVAFCDRWTYHVATPLRHYFIRYFLAPRWISYSKAMVSTKTEELIKQLEQAININRDHINTSLKRNPIPIELPNLIEEFKIQSETMAKYLERLSEELPHKKTDFYTLEMRTLENLANTLFRKCDHENTHYCNQSCNYQLEAINIAKHKLNQPDKAVKLLTTMGNEIKKLLESDSADSFLEETKHNILHHGTNAFAEAGELETTAQNRAKYYLEAGELILNDLKESASELTAETIEESDLPKLAHYFTEVIKNSDDPEAIYKNQISRLETLIQTEFDHTAQPIARKYLAQLTETIADRLKKQGTHLAKAANYYAKSAESLLESTAPKGHIVTTFQQAGDLYAAVLEKTQNEFVINVSAYENYLEATKLLKKMRPASRDLTSHELYLFQAAGHYALQAAKNSTVISIKNDYVEKAWAQLLPVAKYYFTKQDFTQAIKTLEPLGELLSTGRGFTIHQYNRTIDGLKKQLQNINDIFP